VRAPILDLGPALGSLAAILFAFGVLLVVAKVVSCLWRRR